MQRTLPVSRLTRQKSDARRTGNFPKTLPNLAITCWLVALVLLFFWQRAGFSYNEVLRAPRPFPRLRPYVYNLSDFGAVGDGKTLNTAAFESAVAAIRAVANEGGGQLNVESGRWLTAPFNLTSHMTLFLAQNSVILGTQDESYWPLLSPLPSYGRGRELPGPRYGSLIYGQNLQDIVITGYNGTIDGQGQSWWRKHKEKKSKYTRPCLIHLLWSKDILISDVTLQNSPFWTVHPYACNNVSVRGVTVLAPEDSPNTDGIDPDSCKDVLIQDSYISVGDDSVAIKSGWDQYGIKYALPSVNVVIRNVVAHSPVSAGVSIGSEMSGGVTDILIEKLHVWGSRRGVRIKTSAGRGGYVTNVMYKELRLENVRVGIVIKTDYGDHPDDKFDAAAYPKVDNISYHGVYGKNVRVPVRMYGSQEIPITGVEFKDMDVGVTRKKKNIFQCSFVEGRVVGNIYPAPCQDLVKTSVNSSH